MLRHLDLFSGIGGFAIAVRIVGGIQTTQFVEIDPYCQKVLAKNFPGVPIHGDIRTYTANPGDFDIITFGSPCQDFSIANPNGRGLEGERSGLFFEAIRLLCLVRPRYAVFENVANVLTKDGGLQFQQILRAFYESGFDAEWQVISAASVGAPHLRERLFIIAHSDGKRCCDGRSHRKERQICRDGEWDVEAASKDGKQLLSAAWAMGEADAHANGSGREKLNTSKVSTHQGHSSRSLAETGNYWRTEPCPVRVADGIPDRIHRIAGLGNAVVPQVAAIPLRRVLQLAGEIK